VDNKIVVSPLIGVDRTSWSWSVSLFFDWTSASNVKEVAETQSENRANVAIWISNDWSKLMVYDNEDYPYWLVIDNFQSGDLSVKTNSLLDRNNVDKRNISVLLDETKNMTVNVWDKLNLRIEGLNTIDDFIWSVFVVGKTTTYKYGKKYEIVEVGNSSSETWTLSSLIKNMNDKIDKIRNK
jgi:hypothetical protein